jgi:hypothetical protein
VYEAAPIGLLPDVDAGNGMGTNDGRRTDVEQPEREELAALRQDARSTSA